MIMDGRFVSETLIMTVDGRSPRTYRLVVLSLSCSPVTAS